MEVELKVLESRRKSIIEDVLEINIDKKGVLNVKLSTGWTSVGLVKGYEYIGVSEVYEVVHPLDCKHDFWVYSTAVASPSSILVQCSKCKTLGHVSDYTREEWNDAFHAPAKSYRFGRQSKVKYMKPPI